MNQFNDLLMARYEAGGRGPNYDCFGLFRELCRRRGQNIPDHPSPVATSERETIINRIAAAEWIKLDKPEPGCAVLLRIGPWVSHIGMVMENGLFVHSNSKTGITVAHLDDVRWRSRLAGFYRYGKK